MTASIKCPVCGDTHNQLLKDSSETSRTRLFGVGVFECKKCAFIFSDYIDSEVLSVLYTYMFRDPTASSTKELHGLTRANGKSQLITIQPHLPKKLGRVLDFGGGYGEAARLYLPFSEEVYIVEKDPDALEHIRKTSKLEILEEEDLLKDKYIGFFDLVIFSNVLEHMPFPLQQIQKFSRMIAEGGFLFVEVPCEFELIRESMAAPLHIGFYSLESFTDLIKIQGSFDFLDIRRCGASIEKIREGGKFIHDTESQNTEDGYEIRALLKNVRPKQKILERELNDEEAEGTVGNLSEILLRFASARGS